MQTISIKNTLVWFKDQMIHPSTLFCRTSWGVFSPYAHYRRSDHRPKQAYATRDKAHSVAKEMGMKYGGRARKEINRQSKDFQDLVRRAYHAMFARNESFRTALLSTGKKTLSHGKGGNDPYKTILTGDEFCGTLMDLRDKD